MMRRILTLCLLIDACANPNGPTLPVGAERVAPLGVYRQWWALVEACSGRTGDFDAVAWYTVPNVFRPAFSGRIGSGAWYPDGNSIVLTAHSLHLGDLVRHEMLHALLGKSAAYHPRDQFIVNCGGVVWCDGKCITDGGPAAPSTTGAILIAPTAVIVNLQVLPAAPSSSTFDGYFWMTVTARNPENHPVIVQLHPPSGAGESVSFEYRIIGGGNSIFYAARALAPEVTRFGPSETKRFIFDMHVVGGLFGFDVPPAVYDFNGAYGGVWAPQPLVVTVGK